MTDKAKGEENKDEAITELSGDETADVKGGFSRLGFEIQDLKPMPKGPLPGGIEPIKGFDPKSGINKIASGQCAETGDSGTMGCPG